MVFTTIVDKKVCDLEIISDNFCGWYQTFSSGVFSFDDKRIYIIIDV